VAEFRELNIRDVERYTSRSSEGGDASLPEGKEGFYEINTDRRGNVTVTRDDEFVDIEVPKRGKASVPIKDGFYNVPSVKEAPARDYVPITKFGASIDVASKLDSIVFLQGSTGGMQNRIAYIRYWSRKGTEQKAETSSAVQTSSPTSSAPEKASEAVNQVQPISFDTSKLERELGQTAFTRPGSGIAFPLGPETQAIPETPTQRSNQFDLPGTPAPVIITPAQPPKPPEQPRPISPAIPDPTVREPLPADSGKVYNANPGAPSTVTPSIGGASSQSVWQFLFNPEELQLDSGPDYNRAETWGVSDPANSGQPLSWKSNKNRKLIFGKVLLTGYVIGKRVDSLERGLQQLFMARDGENGNDGPPVLEFVWGARVFGPCVIQNIRVRERAWDAGALVNAEVSFELEQVPEWTINDGFVDIARPGRMPLVNDPLLPRSGVGVPAAPETQGESGTTTAPANQPGGGTADPKKLSSTNCNALNSDSRAWQDMGGLANKNKSGLASARVALIPFFNFPVPVPPGSQSFQDTYPGNRDKYSKLLEKATSNSFYGSGVNSNTIGSECFNLSSAWSTSGTIPEWQKRNSISNDTLIKCSTKIKNAIDSVYNSNQCKNFTIEQGFQGPAIR
jgi:hypothetical protein